MLLSIQVNVVDDINQNTFSGRISFTETMVTFGEKENAINAYIFMKTVWHTLSVKTFHF